MGLNLTEGQQGQAITITSRAHYQSVLAILLMFLVVLEEHHLFAACQVALVPNNFNDNLGEQVLALSHGLPASGADSLTFSDLLKTSCANDVASGTAWGRTISWDVEADWALQRLNHKSNFIENESESYHEPRDVTSI